MICGNAALLYEPPSESNGRKLQFSRSTIGRFYKDSSLDRATRLKETEDSRAACLRNVGERNSHEDGNEGQPTGVLQDLAVTDDHQTCVGSPASGTAGAPGSRSSPRFTRPNLLLKRPLTTTAAVARSPTKTSGPLKENRQAANERAVQVYSAGAAIGARRPRPPSRAGSTSPGGGGSRSRWNERGLPSEERKRPVASAGRRQSFPLPSHDVGMGKQEMNTDVEEDVHQNVQRLPSRPHPRGGEGSKAYIRPSSSFAMYWGEEENGGTNISKAKAQQERKSNKRPIATKEQARSQSAGTRFQGDSEETPAAQRARILELKRLATEKTELEAQLAEVKQLMRAATTGKVCWKEALSGMLGARPPKKCRKLVRRKKKKRRPSSVPSAKVVREPTASIPSSAAQRGSAAERPNGGERVAWIEHVVNDALAAAAEEEVRRTRRKSGDRDRAEAPRCGHGDGQAHLRTVNASKVVDGISLSKGRSATAGEEGHSSLGDVTVGVGSKLERRKSASRRPQSAPRRPMARAVNNAAASGTAETATRHVWTAGNTQRESKDVPIRQLPRSMGRTAIISTLRNRRPDTVDNIYGYEDNFEHGSASDSNASDFERLDYASAQQPSTADARGSVKKRQRQMHESGWRSRKSIGDGRGYEKWQGPASASDLWDNVAHANDGALINGNGQVDSQFRANDTGDNGSALSWSQWNQQRQSASSTKSWENGFRVVRGDGNSGTSFERVGADDSNRDGIEHTETWVAGFSSPRHGNIDGARLTSHDNFSSVETRRMSNRPKDGDGKLHLRDSSTEEGRSTAPISEVGSSLYDIRLSSHDSTSDDTWSLGSYRRKITSDGRNTTAHGGSHLAPHLRSRYLKDTRGERRAPTAASSSDGSSLFEMWSSTSHNSTSPEDTPLKSSSAPDSRRQNDTVEDAAARYPVRDTSEIIISETELDIAPSSSGVQLTRPCRGEFVAIAIGEKGTNVEHELHATDSLDELPMLDEPGDKRSRRKRSLSKWPNPHEALMDGHGHGIASLERWSVAEGGRGAQGSSDVASHNDGPRDEQLDNRPVEKRLSRTENTISPGVPAAYHGQDGPWIAEDELRESTESFDELAVVDGRPHQESLEMIPDGKDTIGSGQDPGDGGNGRVVEDNFEYNDSFDHTSVDCELQLGVADSQSRNGKVLLRGVVQKEENARAREAILYSKEAFDDNLLSDEMLEATAYLALTQAEGRGFEEELSRGQRASDDAGGGGNAIEAELEYKDDSFDEASQSDEVRHLSLDADFIFQEEIGRDRDAGRATYYTNSDEGAEQAKTRPREELLPDNRLNLESLDNSSLVAGGLDSGYQDGARRLVKDGHIIEDGVDCHDAFGEVALDSKPRSGSIREGVPNGLHLHDRPRSTQSFDQYSPDKNIFVGQTPDIVAPKDAQLETGSNYRVLRRMESSQDAEFTAAEDHLHPSRETIALPFADGKIDNKSSLDELLPLDEEAPHQASADNGLSVEQEGTKNGESRDKHKSADIPEGQKERFDGDSQIGDALVGGALNTPDGQEFLAEGDGALDEYLFDEFLEDPSVDGDSFDIQSLGGESLDDNSFDGNSLGGQTLGDNSLSDGHSFDEQSLDRHTASEDLSFDEQSLDGLASSGDGHSMD